MGSDAYNSNMFTKLFNKGGHLLLHGGLFDTHASGLSSLGIANDFLFRRGGLVEIGKMLGMGIAGLCQLSQSLGVGVGRVRMGVGEIVECAGNVRFGLGSLLSQMINQGIELAMQFFVAWHL